MSLASSFMARTGPRGALAYLSGVIEGLGESSKFPDYQKLADAVMARAKQLDDDIKFEDQS